MYKRLIVFLLAFAVTVTSCRKAEVVTPAPDVAANDNKQLEALFAGEPPHMCINKQVIDADGKKTNGVVLRDKYWNNGKKIRIKFMNGTTFLRAKVLTYARKWSEFANVTFLKVEGDEAHDLRIAFKFNGDTGSWSYYGTDARLIDKSGPTMNFGWFTATTDEAEFSRVIIHEIGHALGLGHEQSSPAVNIKWNKTNVYWYYQRPPNNWTIAQIDNNIFQKFTPEQVYYSPFDPKSIMQYPVDPRFTTNGQTIGINTILSSMDKIVISKVYPKN
ncbi:MAG: matrixin family metalloprotease [Sphingobacteriales bacterium]|nr:MAG: matrixin family metalloprotease [Sphingobacteriales bacterium]